MDCGFLKDVYGRVREVGEMGVKKSEGPGCGEPLDEEMMGRDLR